MQQVTGVERARQPVTDERAFADLMRPLAQPAFRLALGLLHDRHAAEDVVQEASLLAWRKLGTMREPEKLRSWFLGVVANNCRNARRLKWTAGVTLGLPEHLAVGGIDDETLRHADLRRAISRLRYADRVVVVLYFYLDMPLDEVAQITRTTLGATRARLYRSIERLRPGVEIEEALT